MADVGHAELMHTRLDHVRANVADLERTVEWYTSVLDFEVESYWPPEEPNYAHFVAVGGATFAVMEADGRGGGSTSPWRIRTRSGNSSRTTRP